MNSESKNEVIVSNNKDKKVTRPKYTGRDNYYFDESGDYEHHYADCDVCDRSVFKRTIVDGLCEMCDEKSQLKRKHFKKK